MAEQLTLLPHTGAVARWTSDQVGKLMTPAAPRPSSTSSTGVSLWPILRGSYGKRISGKCSSAEPSWHMTNQIHQHLILKNFKVKMVFKIHYNEYQYALHLDLLIVLIYSHLSIYMLLKHWNVSCGYYDTCPLNTSASVS